MERLEHLLNSLVFVPRVPTIIEMNLPLPSTSPSPLGGCLGRADQLHYPRSPVRQKHLLAIQHSLNELGEFGFCVSDTDFHVYIVATRCSYVNGSLPQIEELVGLHRAELVAYDVAETPMQNCVIPVCARTCRNAELAVCVYR